MAGKAELSRNLEPERSPTDSAGPIVEDFDPKRTKKRDDPVFQKAAELFGLGYTTPQVAKLLVKHLVPNGQGRPLEQNLSHARQKVRNWSKRQDFRVFVYQKAGVRWNWEILGFFKGVATRAKRVGVDPE